MRPPATMPAQATGAAPIGGPRAVQIARYGPPEVLVPRPIAVPEPGPGEVRVRVRAAGVNYADVFGRLGLYAPAPPAPYVPGFEVAGEVDAVGPGVAGLAPGDPVIAGTRFGGYATHVVTGAGRLLPLPAGWSFAEGAGFLATYATAWHALVGLGRARAGSRVLVHAGAGGVGTAAIQIGRHLGCHVVATAGGPERARFTEERGAHAGVDYLRRGWAERARAAAPGAGFDVVLDSVLGPTFARSLDLLAPLGTLVVCGAASFTPRGPRRNWATLAARWLARPRLDPLALIPRNAAVAGFNILLLWEQEEFVQRLGAALLDLSRAPGIRPILDRSYPLDRAAEAHERLQGRRARGKIVLET